MNVQTITKRVESDGHTLRLHSLFYTIQGEGPFAGRPAVFVRLAGCNLQCPACDTEYTEGARDVDAREIAEHVLAHCTAHHLTEPIVVITGGEPFRQNITHLVRMLTAACFTVQIETNGTLPPQDLERFKGVCNTPSNPEGRCFVVCSPKAGRVHPDLSRLVFAYKYVMAADSVAQDDGLPIEVLGHPLPRVVARPHDDFSGTVYLQPCDSKDEELNQRNLAACIASCMKYGYTLQLQIHKIINME
jgi:organic radical activating enzyme